MCEPYHSICQYPSDDSHNDSGTGSSSESRIRIGLGGLGEWLKKIGNWFHLSRFGSGHSESEKWAHTSQLWIPSNPIKYEVAWWNRQVALDGWYPYSHSSKDDSLECAAAYAHRTSIGSLHQLRQFLEVSLKRTERGAHHYIERFMLFLNKLGQDACHKRLKESLSPVDILKRENTPTLTKILLGFTRKRQFVNDVWADNSLWKPTTPQIVMA